MQVLLFMRGPIKSQFILVARSQRHLCGLVLGVGHVVVHGFSSHLEAEHQALATLGGLAVNHAVNTQWLAVWSLHSGGTVGGCVCRMPKLNPISQPHGLPYIVDLPAAGGLYKDMLLTIVMQRRRVGLGSRAHAPIILTLGKASFSLW